MMQNQNEEVPQSSSWGWSHRIQGSELYDISYAKKARSWCSNCTSTEEPLFFLQKLPSLLSPGACTEAHRLQQCIAAFLGEKGTGQC